LRQKEEREREGGKMMIKKGKEREEEEGNG